MANLEFTGERLLPNGELNHLGDIEHLHRYAFASYLVKNKDVLDIACGDGYGSALLSAYANKIVGVDISSEVIEIAKQKYQASHISFLNGRAEAIPLPDNSIDVIVSFETIEHHDKHHEMLLEFKRVLRKGGMVILSTPIKRFYQEREPDNQFHIKELEFEEFQDLLSSHFQQVRMYKQQIVFGSLIADDIRPLGLQQSSGNFNRIQHQLSFNGKYNVPYFTLAVCSDESIDVVDGISFFDGSGILVRKEQRLEHIVQSFEYRLSRIITFPWRRFKRIFGAKSNV